MNIIIFQTEATNKVSSQSNTEVKEFWAKCSTRTGDPLGLMVLGLVINAACSKGNSVKWVNVQLPVRKAHTRVFEL